MGVKRLGTPLISVMTAVNWPRGSLNRSVGNPTYWRIIDYVVTSYPDTNGLIVVATIRCDRFYNAEICLSVIFSQLCKFPMEIEAFPYLTFN